MADSEGQLLHRGSCICTEYELRITERCLVDDLDLPADSSFEDALKRPIVQSFLEKRRNDPGSGKTVGPVAGNRTLRHLGRGDDHRGATWFDQRNNVVWLCAYGFHRSGECDDAFRKFDRLIDDDAMRPKTADYRRLGRDRAGRFAELAADQAASAVIESVAREGEIIRVDLGHQLPVRIQATIAGDAAELSLVFPSANLNSDQILFVVRCFTGTSGDLWENTEAFAGEPLAGGELGFTVWREVP